MGLIFGNAKIDELKQRLDSIYENIKINTTRFTEWIRYFKRKDEEQDSRLNRIEKELHNTNNIQNEDKFQYVYTRLNDLEHYKFGAEERQKLNFLYNKVNELEENSSIEHIHTLSSNQMIMLNKIKELENRLVNMERKPAPTIRVAQPIERTAHDRIVQKVKQKSKDYIKSAVISLIKKYENITGSQLKEIIVEEQGLCSRSSFYRILDEIEAEEKIRSERDGREKNYSIVQILR